MGAGGRPRIRHREGRVWQLRVELDAVQPRVWRRISVSARASLQELHDILQRVMRRDPAPAYRFEIDGVEYLGPDDEAPAVRGAAAASLDSLDLHPGARFVHAVDDHTGSWRHLLTLELSGPRLVGQRLPACLAGGGAAPPLACAGPQDYQELLNALDDPLDPRRADWQQYLPEDFDPGYADLPSINAALSRVKKHRPAA
jgi:hypothetical protein